MTFAAARQLTVLGAEQLQCCRLSGGRCSSPGGLQVPPQHRLTPGGEHTTLQVYRVKTERDERRVRERVTSLYLALDLALELALQPVAAVLGVPQGLRNGPQLSCNSSFLLHNLLQLWGGSAPINKCLSSDLELRTHQSRWAESYLGADLLHVLVSLLDFVHAALQVCVELDPLGLQPTHQLVLLTLL